MPDSHEGGTSTRTTMEGLPPDELALHILRRAMTRSKSYGGRFVPAGFTNQEWETLRLCLEAKDA